MLESIAVPGYTRAAHVRVQPGEAAAVLAEAQDEALEHLSVTVTSNVDLSPLGELSSLKSLIVVGDLLRHDGFVARLRNLKRLQLFTHATSSLDFSGLGALRELRFRWRPKVAGLASLPHLASLTVSGFSGSAEPKLLSSLPSLKRLQLENSRLESFADLGVPQALERLTLAYNPALTSSENLTSPETLQIVGLQSCKHFNSEQHLSNARLLALRLENQGSIPSLGFLANSRELEQLELFGDTNIEDGRLRGLVGLGTLWRFKFRARRHYDITPGEVAASLSARAPPEGFQLPWSIGQA